MRKSVISKRAISSVLCLLMLALCVAPLTGCSSNSIVGMWSEVKDDGTLYDSKMYFNKDGTCHDISYHGRTGAHPVSYKILDDGKLVFTMEWDGDESFDLADSEEEAKEEFYTYYVSGDTLIFRTRVYKRV